MMKGHREDGWRRAETGMRACCGGGFRALFPFLLFLACVLVKAGSACSSSNPSPASSIAPCKSRQPVSLAAPGSKPGVTTVSAGTIAGSFSVNASGEASYVIPLTAVPGRAGVEPRLPVVYDGSGDGVLGVGFSLAGLSAL